MKVLIKIVFLKYFILIACIAASVHASSSFDLAQCLVTEFPVGTRYMASESDHQGEVHRNNTIRTNQGGSIVFNVDGIKGGTFELVVAYISPRPLNMVVSINGDNYRVASAPKGTDWKEVIAGKGAIQLLAGENTISLKAASKKGKVAVSYIELVKIKDVVTSPEVTPPDEKSPSGQSDADAETSSQSEAEE